MKSDVVSASQESEATPSERRSQIWNELDGVASDLACFEDQAALVLSTLASVRQEAASIREQLASYKVPVTADEQSQGGGVAAEFDGVAQDLADRLRGAVTEALAVATTNNLATDEYWRHADIPQNDIQGMLDNLSESLESLGIAVPDSEERRIHKAAYKMAVRLHGQLTGRLPC